MFAAGPRGHLGHSYYYYSVCFVITVIVVILGDGRCVVVGRPQGFQDKDTSRGPPPTAAEAQHQNSVLRFFPELLPEPPTQDTSGTSSSSSSRSNSDNININNVIPTPPVFPIPLPLQPPIFDDSNKNNHNNLHPTVPRHDLRKKYPDDNDDEDINGAPPFSGDGPLKDFSSVPPFSGDGPRKDFRSAPLFSGDGPIKDLSSAPPFSGDGPLKDLSSAPPFSGDGPLKDLRSAPPFSGDGPLKDLRSAPLFSGDGPREEIFGRDLDRGHEETWEPAPDLVHSDVPPPPSYVLAAPNIPPTTLNQPEGSKLVAAAVSPDVEDVSNVDRLQEILSQLSGIHEEDSGKEELGVPELLLETRGPGERLPSAGARSAGYDVHHTPHRVMTAGGAQGSIVPSSPRENTARDVDVNGVNVPNPNIVMPDDVPVDLRKDTVVPWPEMLQRDVDVDRPIPYGEDSSSPYFSLPESSELSAFSDMDDTDLQEWKRYALEELENMDGDRVKEVEEPLTDIDVDYEIARSPFEDDDEEEGEENEVPEELVRQVIRAMNAPGPAWLDGIPAAESTTSLEREWEALHDDEDEEEEEIWIVIADDDDDNDNYDDNEGEGYLELVPTGAQTGSSLRGNSRLISLILETIGTPEEDGAEAEDAEAGEVNNAGDAYDKQLGMWQVLTNFPFPMLLGHSDQFADGTFAVDYSYDNDVDDDDYYYDDEDYYDDDEYYYDEEYDDEEYEDYEDYDEEEEEEGEGEKEEEDGENVESDGLDDYFYSSETYDDCEDCVEKDDVVTHADEKQEDMTVLSLPSMLVK